MRVISTSDGSLFIASSGATVEVGPDGGVVVTGSRIELGGGGAVRGDDLRRALAELGLDLERSPASTS